MTVSGSLPRGTFVRVTQSHISDSLSLSLHSSLASLHRPPRTVTLFSRVVAPSFVDYDDGLDTEMGEDEDNAPAFDPV